MDKAILSLVTILIAGTGVIGSLITYDPPELNATYFGFNPFGYKRTQIDKVVRRAFVYLAFIGLGVQAYPLFVTGLPDQNIRWFFTWYSSQLALLLWRVLRLELENYAWPKRENRGFQN